MVVECALGYDEPGIIVAGGVADDSGSDHQSRDEELVSQGSASCRKTGL